jgi:hypothetical protein
MTSYDLRVQYPLYLKKSMYVYHYIDMSKPFKHILIRDTDVPFYTFLHMHMKLGPLETPLRKDIRAILLFKKMIYSKDCMHAYTIFLKRLDVETSILRCIHMMYKKYYMLDVSFEELITSKIMKHVMIQMKYITYMYLHHMMKYPYFIKTKTLDDLHFFIHKNVACMCLDESYLVTDIHKKLLFKFQIPLIKTTLLEDIKSIHIDLASKKVRWFKESFVSNAHITSPFKHVVMYNTIHESSNLHKIYYHDMNDMKSDLQTIDMELSLLKSEMNTHIKTHHVFLLPTLNEALMVLYIDFFNHINPLLNISIYLRGGFHIDDFFKSYQHFKSLLKHKHMIHDVCVIMDTDELSFHLNQIKKSQKIDHIVIDMDALLFDIFDEKSDHILSKHWFKTHYLYVFKEIHSHLRIQGISHALYSKHLLNKDIYRMLKVAGFKEFLFEDTHT